MATILHRPINGQSYTFTWLDPAAGQAGGWKVTAATSRTDRFWRSYFVRCDPKGRPVRCTCPHYHEKSAWCKHLREAEAIYREQHAVEEAAVLRESMIRHGVPVPAV